MSILSPDILLKGYSVGVFPMADSRDDPEVFWVDPERRGIIPLNGFHMSRSLARKIRREAFSVTFNQDFAAVMDGCADRPDTWINAEIRQSCLALHADGFAHSVEIWSGKSLVGGVYGIALGAAFFGESMFSRQTDASKVALAYLVDHLNRAGFSLLDTQFLTPHLASLGGIEISRARYHALLSDALEHFADFNAPAPASGQDVVQRNTQTS